MWTQKRMKGRREMKEKKADQKKADQRVVKRYRNRKLYDTLESCYVTLEDIADLIRQGIDVTVIDNNTQEDLTSVTLAQIILEEERRKKVFVPLGTLTQLIRSGGETIKGLVSKSLGGIKEINYVKAEIQNNLEKLISIGGISTEEGNKIVNGVKNFIESKIRPTVENVQNIPSVQSEMKHIKSKLCELEKKLNSTEQKKKKR